MASFATVVNAERGEVVCERCLVADAPVARLRGLLGRDDLPPGEGVLLRPASAVHMAFMRFSIDAVFLGRDLDVIDVVSGLRPWRIAGRRGSHAVLELATGEGERRSIRPGDRLRLVDSRRGRPAPEERDGAGRG
jgi:uncharacterized membrane protein (UPF0127 family)